MSVDMDGMTQSSTANGSGIVGGSTSSPSPQPHEVLRDGAEYLRFFGLTIPYEDVLQPWMMDEPSKLVSPLANPAGITSSNGLEGCSIPSVVPAPERWEVPSHSLTLIRDVCKQESAADVEGHIRQIRKRAEATSIRRLKLELPILRTDNQADLREYHSNVSAAREVQLAKSHLILEPCDEEKDEGLGFPPEACGVDGGILKSIEREKIEISKNAFQTLLGCMKADWTEADQDAILASQAKYTGLISWEPITPPLTPALVAVEPFVPDGRTCEIPQPSDPNSVFSDDLRKVEDRFCVDDKLVPSNIDTEQFDEVTDLDMLCLVKSIPQLDDLKVEEPLLPVVAGDQVDLGPDLGSIRDDIKLDLTTEADVRCQNSDKALTESPRETAAGVTSKIEQEKPEPLDATIRVAVPVLDFSTPEPNWCKLRDSSAIFRSIPRESNVEFNGTRWSTKLIDQTKMNWRIWLADTPKPSIEGPISNMALLGAFLELPRDLSVPTSFCFVRKKSGLAILDGTGYDDEEELQPLVPPSKPPLPKGDWMSLLRTRKLSYNGDDSTNQSKTKDGICGSKRRRGAQGLLLVQGEESTAATLLDNYLKLHPPKKMRLEHSHFFKPTCPSPARDERSVEKTCDASRPPKESLGDMTTQPEVVTLQLRRSMVCPEIPQLPLKVVAAVTLPRGMIEALERCLAGLQMMYRDYNAHNVSVWIRGSTNRTDVASALADEADLIPAPSTGIVLTTMIKVRQKQIQGADRKTAHLLTRVEGIAARYERLVILVSEDNKLDESMNAMSASDTAAFAVFQAFCATLPTETMVLYIGGGVQTLAKWAAAIAARYAAGSHYLHGYLREGESHWELFLRRAGMNAYAAQVVLGMLRVPDGEPLITHERAYGLPAFIKMTEEQRYAMFEGTLGGRRVLARVGKVLDAEWNL